MKIINFFFIVFVIFFSACNSAGTSDTTIVDTLKTNDPIEKVVTVEPIEKVYANERFKNVVVNKISRDSIAVSGKAQVFEATMNWVLTKGYKEIKSGYETTSAGAPAWGDFNFHLKVPEQLDSTMHVILFESSAKDGSRISELIIPLVGVQ